MSRFFFMLIAVTLLFGQAANSKPEHDNTSVRAGKAKYIFLLIGDGMGFAQLEAAEKAFRNEIQPRLWINTLPVKGALKTCSLNGAVTDSAAAVTAMACGQKTLNKMLGVDPDGKALETIAETAKKSGWGVGIVSSAYLNHATPAGFYAHRKHRNMYNRIIEDLARSNFDYFGGNSFLYGDDAECGKLQAKLSRSGYLMLKLVDNNVLPLEAGKKYILHKQMSFVLDRNPEGYVSLADFTRLGIQHLYRGDGKAKGFFMMIEGGRIDWSCHANDTGGMINELWDFDQTVKVVLDFYKQHPGETTIVVTADHETGGLEFIPGIKPEAELSFLLRQRHSYAFISREIHKLKNENAPLEKVIALFKSNYGINEFSAEELKQLETAWKVKRNENKILYASYEPVIFCLQHILCRRCGLKWKTTSHTAEPVPVFAIGVDAKEFSGVYDNTQLAYKLRKLILGK